MAIVSVAMTGTPGRALRLIEVGRDLHAMTSLLAPLPVEPASPGSDPV
jgi:hypothetical protein